MAPASVPAAGFERWSQDFSQGFTIVRFRAPSAHRVTEAELLNASFGEWPRNLSSVVLQKATGR